MTDVVLIAVVLLLALPVALWARGASRRMAAALIPAPPVVDVVRRPHVDAPVVHQLLDQVAGEAARDAFVRQALAQAGRDNAATYAAATAAAETGRHRRPDGDLPPGTLGMTGIMAKLDAAAVAADARMRAAIAAETGPLPAVRP